MAPRSPKMAQDGPNMASRWLQDGFKTAHMAPRWLQDGPQWPLRGPKMAPDGLRRPLGGPRWPKTGPKWPQDGLQLLHDRRKLTPISLLHNIYLLNACQLPGRLLKMGRPFAFVGFRWFPFVFVDRRPFAFVGFRWFPLVCTNWGGEGGREGRFQVPTELGTMVPGRLETLPTSSEKGGRRHWRSH